MNNLVNHPHANGRSHDIIGWSLLAGLLFLRLPLYTGMALFPPRPDWLVPSVEIGFYFFTACLIWWERERLADFHVDKLALIIVIIFGPAQTVILAARGHDIDPLTFPHLPSFGFWIISIGLICALWVSRASLPKLSKSSFV